MKAYIIAAFSFLWMAVPQPSQAQNGMQLVGATAQEAAAAQAALDQVLGLFESMGAPVVPGFKVIFEDEVELPGGGPQVFGYFDTDTREIHMLHFRNPRQSERRPWGLEWSDELAASFLLHEIAHMVVISYMGPGYKVLSHAWHEAIAYDIQLEMMSESLRRQVAAVYAGGPRDKAYSDREAVNAFIYESDPEMFAYRISLSFPQWGGHDFLKQLIEGKVRGTQEKPQGGML